MFAPSNQPVEQQAFAEKLETERLLLRRYQGGDAAGIVELVRENRVLLVREFARTASLATVDDAQAFIAEKDDQWNSGKTFCYGIWLKRTSQQIGQIQIKNIAWDIPSAELGYFTGAAWQRQGYASESIRHILLLAFAGLNFQRIFLRILPSNAESLALAKKLGFQEEGLNRNAFRCGFGDLHDVRILSLTPGDYQRQAAAGADHS